MVSSYASLRMAAWSSESTGLGGTFLFFFFFFLTVTRGAGEPASGEFYFISSVISARTGPFSDFLMIAGSDASRRA